jgi:hypothetical protein
MTRRLKSDPIAQPFPRGVPKPAVRALVAAGYTSVEQLTKPAKRTLLAFTAWGQKHLEFCAKHLSSAANGLSHRTIE